MQTLADIRNITTKDLIIVANNRQIIALKNQIGEGKASFLPQITTIKGLLQQLGVATISEIELFLLFNTLLLKQKMKFSNQSVKDIISTYHKLRQYKINLDEINPSNNKQEVFKKIITEYYQYKNKNNLFDIFDLYDKVKKEAKNYYHFGFKTPNPLDEELLNKLASTKLELNIIKPKINKFRLISDVEEIKYVSKWAYDLYLKDSSKSIVIVHPELEKYSSQFGYFFNKLFKQYYSETKDKSFNVSLGKTLVDYKLGAELNLWIQIYYQSAKGAVKSSDLVRLIGSRYCNLDDNIIEKINTKNLEYLTTKDFISLDKGFSKIAQISQQQISQKDILPTINQLLKNFGFLTDTKLSSDEYQLFIKIKQELMSLNLLEQPMNSHSLFMAINYILSNKVFSPQSASSKGKRQIQVMGALEAEGLRFDYAWVMGLNNEILPKQLNPPEYLPFSLAQAKNMVNCSFENNLTDATGSIEFFSQLAPWNNFSFASTVSEVETMPSALISWTQAQEIKEEEQPPNKTTKTKLESKASRVKSAKLKKAVSVIKAQNLCGFKGFATRLHIQDIEEVVVGISAKDKGILLHKSLELIYTELEDSDKLCSIEEQKLDQIIKQSIKKASSFLEPSLIGGLEQEILFFKLKDFIEKEKTRKFKVKSLEKIQKFTIAEFSFELRIDRIDEDQEGNIIILDYKNTRINLKQAVNRLTEPQLPLYGMVIDNSCLGFVNFKDGVKYQYFANHNLLPASKNPSVKDYKAQQQIWKKQILEVVNNFKNGVATITPTAEGCMYCNLENLCRKKELNDL